MKVLLIDTKLAGHHIYYFKSLADSDHYESLVCAPGIINDIDSKQIEIKNFKITNYIEYYKFIKETERILIEEKPDIVHFLYGDMFYRYFGIGLSKFKKYKTIASFHQIRNSFFRNLSRKKIFSKINIGVVHTETILKELNNSDIKNVRHIEYTHFNDCDNISREFALNYLGLSDQTPVLLALAGTRFDKGLDILLEALNFVNKPFQFLIAGRELAFDKAFIEKKINSYKENVKLLLRYLSDEEFSICINACDFMVLPYRKSFNGTSGPLVEGVWLRKTIIGTDHGSLGHIITTNKIGVTFISEDSYDLSKVINEQLVNKHEWNDTAEKYRLTLSRDRFKNDYLAAYNEIRSK